MKDVLSFGAEYVELSGADISVSPWSDYLDKNPTIERKFKGGKGRPVFIDLLMGDREFTPFHRDTPDKNGKKYRLSRESLEKAVQNGAFDGLPVLMYKLGEKSHGFKNKDRKVIGTTHGAITVEDDRGLVVQVLGQVWDSEIPDEFKNLKEKQGQIGASAEFDINNLIDGDVAIINEFTPSGALLLDKSNAAFKQTALYCSDSVEGGEPEAEQNTDKEKTNCDNEKIKPKRGRNMIFCENCAPLAEKIKTEAKAASRKEFQDELQKYAVVKTEKDTLAAAAADTQKEKENLAQKLEDAQQQLAQLKKEQKEAVAAANAEKKFQERKDRYPEDKHQEIRHILLRLEMGQIVPEDILNLADWQTTPKAKDVEDEDEGEDSGKKLSLAGAPSDDGKYQSWSADQCDKILLRTGIISQSDIDRKGGK